MGPHLKHLHNLAAFSIDHIKRQGSITISFMLPAHLHVSVKSLQQPTGIRPCKIVIQGHGRGTQWFLAES